MKVFIKDLKKGDKFRFNNIVYRVLKKYRNDDSPLKATDDSKHWMEEELFYFDELEIEKI